MTYPTAPQAPYIGQEAPPRSQGLSVASMVLGIVSLIVPFVGLATGPLAVIFAGVQLRRHAPGRGMSIAGLVTGIIGTALYAFFLVVIIVGASSGQS